MTNNEEQEESQAPSTVVDMHHHFGNTQVQSSLQGHSSDLDVLIHGTLGLEASGIGAGEGFLSHLGNNGIQRLISRKRISGGSDGEVLPEMSDPNIQRIRTSGGLIFPLVFHSISVSIFKSLFPFKSQPTLRDGAFIVFCFLYRYLT